ncbi:MAG TPA: zinc carboxypeptidase, partial [Thermoanaerobaculia bacterium]
SPNRLLFTRGGGAPPPPPPPPTGNVFFDDFETNQGWTTNPNGTDTAGTGQWERGNPETTTSSGTKQQGTTVSGVNDLVTGRLAGSGVGSFDIDGGTTSIRSPAIALPSSGTLTLSFSYYLAHLNNSSSADFLRVSVVGNTTQQVFQEVGAGNDDDAVWASTSVNVSSFAGQTVRILIEAADAGGASLVEAAVDDVRIQSQ